MENNINDLMINKIMDSEFFCELSTKTDDYGDSILRKLMNKIDCAKKIAEALELDVTIIRIILIAIDIAYPCYGKTGEEFLKSKDKSFSKISYAERVMRTILKEIEENNVNEIYTRIKNVINNSPKAEEEKLVKSINENFKEIDSIQEKEIRGLLIGDFISKVVKEGRITEINPLKGKEFLEKRDKRKLEKETILEILEKAEKYYLENYEEIPEEFKESFSEFTKEQIVAYYIATRTQRKIEKLV